MSKGIKILLGVVAVIVIIVGIAFYATSGLTGVIKEQLSALKSGDMVKAYSLTSKDFQSATSMEDFERFVNHYPAIKNNESTTFTSREVSNDTGMVKGTLHSADGASTPIEYRLVREDGKWKILGIQVSPTGVTVDKNDEQSSSQSTSDSSSAVSSKSGPLSEKFDNAESRYSIQYPNNWEYEKAGQGTVILSGKKGTASYFSTVNIQTVLTKKTGGEFSTTKQFLADLKKQAKKQSPGIKFLDSGPITLSEPNGAKVNGEYATFMYKYKNQEFKQWQIVLLRNDNQVFYAWAYTSPTEQYDSDLKTAKAMLSSWVIY